MQEDLLNLLKRSVIHAGELAVIEEAYGTANYLETLNHYLRYMTRSVEQVSIRDEIRALHHFAELHKPHHVLDIDGWEELEDAFIQRRAIIDFVEQCYRENWEHCAANVPFQVRIVPGYDTIRVIFTASDNQGQTIQLSHDVPTVP